MTNKETINFQENLYKNLDFFGINDWLDILSAISFLTAESDSVEASESKKLSILNRLVLESINESLFKQKSTFADATPASV